MTNKDINYHSGLNSVWTKNLANNQQPDGKALLDHLKTIHQYNAGFTEKCASTCRDRSGRNSYEWLAEAVPDINGTRVLDLACGSGPLLKILHDRNKNFKLKGVDMCGEELSLAKARMSDGVVELFQLEAQNLAAINNASIGDIRASANTDGEIELASASGADIIITHNGTAGVFIEGHIDATGATIAVAGSGSSVTFKGQLLLTHTAGDVIKISGDDVGELGLQAQASSSASTPGSIISVSTSSNAK